MLFKLKKRKKENKILKIFRNRLFLEVYWKHLYFSKSIQHNRISTIRLIGLRAGKAGILIQPFFDFKWLAD